MSDDGRAAAAVRVEGVSKDFRIPRERVHTLKERVVHPLRRTDFEVLHALTDISFEVPPGEFFGIVGRNGSGKSTLLKCLAGIYKADHGEIWLRGRMAPFIELGVGFNPDLTARENVVINAVMLGLTPAEARARYDSIIDFAELEDFVDLKLKNYSSGMQVRLAFAVMVHVDADVLLIDEVLAVGDAAFQQKCHDTLNHMRDEGRTILFVTHDMDSIQRVCDRALLLERGDVLLLGDPGQVAREYNEINFRGDPEADDRPVEGGRSGDGAVQIVEAWFEDGGGRRVQALEQGRGSTFRAKIEVQRAVRDPGLRVTFMDSHHRRVFITGKGTVQGDLEPGELLDFQVRFDNLLGPGRYFATPEIAYPGDGSKLMDRRDDFASVVVTGTQSGGGIVDLPHELEVERVGRTQGAPVR